MAVQTKKSYASATELPTREQAIIMEAIDKISIDEYCKEIGKKIGPAHVRFVSKISNNRICIYVSSKELAHTLVDTHNHILIQGNKVPIRPLISQNKRIILSNVHPFIPNEIIENTLLSSNNIKPVSSISYLRAGLSDQAFTHCYSFRRQMYVKPEDADSIPGSIQINYEGTNYWIYFSNDQMKCFICKENGHQAKNCPVNSNKENTENLETAVKNTPTTVQLPEIKKISHTKNQSVQNQHTVTNNAVENQKKLPIDSTKETNLSPVKRAHSDTDSANSLLNNDTITFQPPILKKDYVKHKTDLIKKKKIRTLSEADNNDSLPLSELKQEMADNPSKYLLTHLQLQSFMEKIINKIHPKIAAAEYTNDPKKLTDMLSSLYPLLTSKRAKNRFSRTIKYLGKNPQDETDGEYDSQCSEPGTTTN